MNISNMNNTGNSSKCTHMTRAHGQLQPNQFVSNTTSSFYIPTTTNPASPISSTNSTVSSISWNDLLTLLSSTQCNHPTPIPIPVTNPITNPNPNPPLCYTTAALAGSLHHTNANTNNTNVNYASVRNNNDQLCSSNHNQFVVLPKDELLKLNNSNQQQINAIYSLLNPQACAYINAQISPICNSGQMTYLNLNARQQPHHPFSVTNVNSTALPTCLHNNAYMPNRRNRVNKNHICKNNNNISNTSNNMNNNNITMAADNKPVTMTMTTTKTRSINPERTSYFVCNEPGCSRQFQHKVNLDIHSIIHTDRALKCNYCEKKFARNANRVQHERIHTNERPYHCKICGKSFKMRSTLKDHHRTHTGEKPFQCGHCLKKFAAKSNLYAHTRNLHS